MMYFKVFCFCLLLVNVGYAVPADINEELFTEVLKESESEVDRITLERNAANELPTDYVPGHARRGITKE